MHFGANTNKGLIRCVNEDFFKIIDKNGNIPYTFIIADGMGGHKAGEVASRLSVELCCKYISNMFESKLTERQVVERLKKITKEVNKEVYLFANSKEENKGMGTTLIIAMVVEQKLVLAHVGDSRVYVLSDGGLDKITTDHSYVEELIKNGTITREEAKNNPNKNLITRAIGNKEDIDVDIYKYPIKDKDVFLMCTDGLTNMVSEKDIETMMKAINEPQILVDELISMSNENGGDDNITVIVFKDNN